MTHMTEMDSPIGTILLTADGTALTGLFMNAPPKESSTDNGWQRTDDLPIFMEAKAQLAAYFQGDLRQFALPLAPEGTAFQQRVWTALQDIPYGTTISYGELARRIGDPNASRAVGLANGRNPISIIIPCHRVIGASGKLVGYGGGISRKQSLLALEQSTSSLF